MCLGKRIILQSIHIICYNHHLLPPPHHIIQPPFQLVINSLAPSLTLLFSPPIIRFHPKLSTIHSYHTLRSSVCRKIVTSISEWSGM